MKYEEYLQHQIDGPGMVKKPYHYRDGERRAIDWFFEWVPTDRSILDVGCGTGTGLRHLQKKGFTDLHGIDIHHKKVDMCRRKDLDVWLGDIEFYTFQEKYDFIWMSHTFEHVYNPVSAIEKIKSLMHDYSELFVILPYPDTGPREVHCASDIIGTRMLDKGLSVMDWFISQELFITEHKFDNYRENEIWLRMEKE